MDRGMVIVGALLTFASSWLGLVLVPYRQLQEQPQHTAPPGVLAAQPGLAESLKAGGAFDASTPEGKARLLDYWPTTEEEGVRVVPTDDAANLVAYLLELRQAETPLPEAKEGAPRPRPRTRPRPSRSTRFRRCTRRTWPR